MVREETTETGVLDREIGIMTRQIVIQSLTEETELQNQHNREAEGIQVAES